MAFALLLDVVRAARVALAAEAARISEGPFGAVNLMRVCGRQKPRRDERGRAVLKRAIRIVDRLHPGGANCYRRVLLEIALDGGAAEDLVMMGLSLSGAPGSGHAWLASEPHHVTYDVLLST